MLRVVKSKALPEREHSYPLWKRLSALIFPTFLSMGGGGVLHAYVPQLRPTLAISARGL